ncbi:hypothetical protein PILCRDRAFT_9567 [Piloderma croceum F 1598]|uniref:Uncharacterized protein n=1 Tax=Piloderma croceum (strain F 1598) TaxID=765440 RepID=A0A0C3BSQ3_PILCF|nr:hypothetical protein PILCRDRAFT_9567 [Piloderma croceum F 1598]
MSLHLGRQEDGIMSEADVKKRIDEDSKEFFAARNLEEAEVYFTIQRISSKNATAVFIDGPPGSPGSGRVNVIA